MDSKLLQEAIKTVEKTLDKELGIHLKGDGSELTIATTNYTSYTATKVPCEVEGELVLPDRLIKIAHSLTGEVGLELGSSLKLTGQGNITIHGSQKEYPEYVADGDKVVIENLHDAISNTVFCIATSEIKPAFQGVLFNFGDILTVTASDTYRLATFTTNYEGDYRGQVLVAGKFLPSILRKRIEYMLVGKTVSFVADDTTYTHSLLDLNYPDISRVIPDKPLTTVHTDIEQLKGCIERARLFKDVVKLTVGERITISVEGEEGTYSDSIDADVEGEHVELYLNGKYFNEGMRGTLTFHGEGGPVVAREGQYMYLLLPVKKS